MGQKKKPSKSNEKAGIKARNFMRKVLNDPKVKQELETRFAPFKTVTAEDLKFEVD